MTMRNESGKSVPSHKQMVSKSFCYLSIFLCCMISSVGLCRGGEGGRKLKVSSYSYSARPAAEKDTQDEDMTKLTDGVIEPSKGVHPHVVWRYKDFGNKALSIDFMLESPSIIERVTFSQFRWKRSYGVKEIRVIGTDLSGSKFSIGNIFLNQPYDLPENEPHNAPVIIRGTDNTPAVSVQLVISGTGSRLGINEVEFFGMQAQARQSDSQRLNVLADTAKPGLRVFKHGPFFILENDFSIYAVDPRYGGALSMAWDKLSKSNLVKFAETGSSFGPLFQDRFYPGGTKNRDIFLYRQFKAEISKDTADEKQVRTWGTGHSGIFSNVEICKTYTLGKGSSVIKVDVTISNGQDNVIPLKYGYWMAGGLQGGSKGYVRIVPGQLGTEVKQPEGQFTSVDFVDGWCGGMDGDNGLAVLFPYECSKEIYYWGANKFCGTIEVKMGIYPVTAGESITYNCAVAPFGGIGVPASVNDRAAAGFGDGILRMRIFKPGKYSLRILEGRTGKGKTTFAPIRTVAVPDNATRYDVPLNSNGKIVKIELLAEGRIVFNAVKSDGVYAVPQAQEKKPDKSGEGGALNLDFHSRDFKTWHWNWGGGFAAGKPKVLYVGYLHGGIREAVELSERFDMDLTTNYVAGYWALSGHTMSLSTDTCLNELSKKLNKNKYDVIIVSGDIWSLCKDNVIKPLLRQVTGGTGLILCGPLELPAELEALFSWKKGKASRFTAAWKDSSHPLAASLPLMQMPPTRFLGYACKGDVIAMAGDSPLLAEAAYGKGRVFLAAWETKRPNPRKGLYNSDSTFMLPMMNEIYPEIKHKYHEYQYALMGRLVQAAAGMNSGISANVMAGLRQTRVRIKNTAKADVVVRLTLRNKYSEEILSLSKNVSLGKGQSSDVFFDYGEPDMCGLHFADVVVMHKNGGALWWGSGVFDVAKPAIRALQFEDRVYGNGEKVKGSVDAEGLVRVSLSDSFGNLLAVTEGGTFSFSLEDVRTPNAFITAELLTNEGKIQDRLTRRVERYSPPDPRIFNISIGWPVFSGKAPVYLIKDILRIAMEQYGVTVASTTPAQTDRPFVQNAMRDMGIRYHNLTAGINTGGKVPYDKNKKVNSKFDLIRIPCLSKDGMEEEYFTKSQKPGWAAKYGALNVGGPDESNLFSHFDGCFCEDCQKAMRKYLQSEYVSLDALNKAWETSFASWDKVVARTLSEVREEGCKSFASWVDHRTFNDISRAKCICAIQRGIHAMNPDLGYSLSGTSETNSWNAWDWYLLMEELYAFSSYVGEQTIQQLSFAKRPIRNMPWSGYDKSQEVEDYSMLSNLMYGASGMSIFGCNLYYYPDWTIPDTGIGLKNIIRKYTNGPAELIMASEFAFEPIALHYSPASIKVDFATGHELARKSSVTGFKGILQDAWCNYSYVSYRQLEKEPLNKYGIIVLPVSMALSDREIDGLERFVRNGGTLIADMVPGLYDQHGTPRTSRKLLSIFGLAKQGVVTKGNVVLNGIKGELAGLSKDVGAYEDGIKLAGGVAYGSISGKPAMVVNSCGKGKAVYMACDIIAKCGELGAMRKNGQNSPFMSKIGKFFGALLAERAIQPKATVELASTQVVVRQLGTAKILGVIRDVSQTKDFDPKPHDAIVRLREKYHVYDLLERRYLGFTNAFEYTFLPTTQAAFILMPYKVEGIKARREGKNISIKLDAPSDVAHINHIFRTRFIAPDGKPSPAYSGLVFGRGTEAVIPFAAPLNQPSTGWKVIVSDAATNVETTLEF